MSVYHVCVWVIASAHLDFLDLQCHSIFFLFAIFAAKVTGGGWGGGLT